MNLLPVRGDGAHATLSDGQKLPVAADGAYTLGIRPTDWVLGDGPLTGTIDVIESLGAEALLHVNLGEEQVIVQVPEPLTVCAGESVQLGVETYHRFDASTGERL